MPWKYHTAKEVTIPLLLYTSLGLFSSHILLLSNGTLGFFHDWFVGPFPEMISEYGYGGFQLYDMNFGNKIYPSDWLIRVFLIPFSFLGGEAISKGMLVFFFVLSGVSMFCFGRKALKLNYYWSLIAGLVYIFSPIVFTRLVAGHFYYMIGYALMPFLLITFCKAQEAGKNQLRYAVASGLVFGLVGIQLQFLVMAFIILIILVLLNYKKIKNGLLSLAFTAIIYTLLHLPWILPLALTPPPIGVASVVQTFLSYPDIATSPTLLESIRMIGYKIQPYSYTALVAQGIIPPWILVTDFLMPIIATIAIIRKRDKYTVGFGLTLIIGIFLLKGPNPPFDSIFVLLFRYTPLIIFRELWHIAFLAFFSYTILTSISLHELTKTKDTRIRNLKAYVLATFLATIIIVSNGYPLLLGNFAGYVQTYSLNEDYNNLYRILQKDTAQYRILWLPSISPMEYNNKSLFGVDPLIQYSPKPTFSQQATPQSPFSRLNMFMASTINENKTQQFGNIISPFATQYVIQRNDFTSKYPLYVPLVLYPDLNRKWEPNVTSSFITNQQDLQLKNETPEFKFYENANPSEFVYTPTIITYGTRDLSTLTQLTKLSNLTDIAYLTDIIQSTTNDPIFLLRNDGFDSIPTLTGERIDPGNYATETDPQKGWIDSKDWFWYNYLFASTINKGVFSKTNSQLDVPVETKGRCEVWAKILKWQNGGKVKFTLGSEREKTVITLSGVFTLEWVKLFDEVSDRTQSMTIANTDGENYIDEIFILNKQIADQTIQSNLENATIIYLIDPKSLESSLVNNFSFEESQANYSLYWSPTQLGFTAAIDNQTAYRGNSSLEVTTQLDTRSWSWIRSSEIPVASDQYEIVTHLKQENAKASHIAIEGFNKATNTWGQLIQLPAGSDGTYDWKTYRSALTVNNDITRLKIVLNAGWVLDETKGNATTWFDDLLIIPSQDSSQDVFLPADSSLTGNLGILKEGHYRIAVDVLGNTDITVANETFNALSNQNEIIDLGSIFLANGSHELEIRASENTHIAALWIYTSTQNKPIDKILTQHTEQAKVAEYKQENPTLWKVRVNASSPFLLAFAAPYDSEWRVYVSNENYQPIPLYGFINGFWINQTGQLGITIEYGPQRWFFYGSILSVTTLLACVTYLTYSFTRDRPVWKQVKKFLNMRKGG